MPKLLLVDDDPGVLSMLGDYFSGRGSTVFCADSARKGLELSLRERPEVAILDLGLPDFSGEEVLKRIKRSMPQMKVIVLTGQTEAGLREKMMKLGSDAYFKKGETPLTEIEKKMHELLV